MASAGKIFIIRSSLPYQLLLYLNGWYFALYWICEALIFIYKGQLLPYPPNVLAAEIVLLFLLIGLEALRLLFGKKGNLTERVQATLLAVTISLASLFGSLYLLIWQAYVLRAEVILNAIQLAFIALELILGLICMITFARSVKY